LERNLKKDEQVESFRRSASKFFDIHTELWKTYFADLMKLGEVKTFRETKLSELEENAKEQKFEPSERLKKKREELDKFRARIKEQKGKDDNKSSSSE